MGKPASRSDLISRIAQDLGLTKVEAKRTVASVLDNIKELAEGEGLTIRDFGTFKVRHRAPRVVSTGATTGSVNVPARRALAFRCSKSLVVAE